MSNPTPPKAFISYSWTSPTHQSWVLSLATRMRQDGIDVVLDKWDLKPGHDSYKFMEQMVTNKSISKVLMICDKKYADKADGREGGVGAESQIISPQLYGQSEQDKFAAIIVEKDDAGKAFVPNYYQGRIYFDLTDGDDFESSYEEMIRWVIDRPSIIKPPIGSIPSHIADVDQPSLTTTSKFRRANDAIRSSSSSAAGMIKDFSDEAIVFLEGTRFTKADTQEEYENQVLKAIKATKPLSDQIITLVAAASRYGSSDSVFEEISELLERIGQLMFRPQSVNSWSQWDSDHFKYLAHKSFLATTAVLIKNRNFVILDQIVSRPYVLEIERQQGAASSSFMGFDVYIESMEYIDRRAGKNHTDPHSAFLKGEFEHHSISFVEMMQADFVLFLRYAILGVRAGSYERWWPGTLVYANRWSPFEIFARAESLKFFDKMKNIFGVTSLDEFKAKVTALAANEHILPKWSFQRLPVAKLSNLEHLGSFP